jgi:hypothetical protein
MAGGEVKDSVTTVNRIIVQPKMMEKGVKYDPFYIQKFEHIGIGINCRYERKEKEKKIQ